MQYLRRKIPSDVAPSRMPSALNQKPIPSLCFSLLVRGPGLYCCVCHPGKPPHAPAIRRTPRGCAAGAPQPPCGRTAAIRRTPRGVQRRPRRSCGAARALRMPSGRPADPAAWALAPPRCAGICRSHFSAEPPAAPAGRVGPRLRRL